MKTQHRFSTGATVTTEIHDLLPHDDAVLTSCSLRLIVTDNHGNVVDHDGGSLAAESAAVLARDAESLLHGATDTIGFAHGTAEQFPEKEFTSYRAAVRYAINTQRKRALRGDTMTFLTIHAGEDFAFRAPLRNFPSTLVGWTGTLADGTRAVVLRNADYGERAHTIESLLVREGYRSLTPEGTRNFIADLGGDTVEEFLDALQEYTEHRVTEFARTPFLTDMTMTRQTDHYPDGPLPV